MMNLCGNGRWLVPCWLLAVLLAVPSRAVAGIHHYRWNVKYQYQSPDCYEKLVIAINGQSPGPTIRAQQGDTIVVELQNDMPTENVAIHWHGIRQIGTPWFDGTEAVSQFPILPRETFVYKFVVDKPGTYFYHGHYGMQRAAGLYGSIQVTLADGVTEPFSYDGEFSLLLNDWWHKSTYDQAQGLSSIPFVWVGEPQSLLIEGRGSYNCSLLNSIDNSEGITGSICNSTHSDCWVPHILSVVPGNTYRLRIASVTSLSTLNFHIEGHNMTVVEADGNYVEPVVVQNLDIYSGQTYSVLITADQNPSKNYWAAINVRGRLPKTPTGRAILNYIPNTPTELPLSTPSTGPAWYDTVYSISQSRLYKARAGYTISPPLAADRRLILLNTQNKINGSTRWAINNVSLLLPNTPYLVSVKYKLTETFDLSPAPETYQQPFDIFNPPSNPNATYGDSIYTLRFNSTVDIILQNANTLNNNNSEIHPWHLHGHDFWVLAHGDGIFDPLKDSEKFNLKNPPKRNTVPVFPYGWTAIRFKADNPGLWAFHCHAEAHLYLGMAVIFAEGIDRIGRLPRSIVGCGESRALLRP